MKLHFLVLLIAAIPIFSTSADEITKTSGAAGAIPDGAGSLVSTVTITAADITTAGQVIQTAEFRLNNIQHSWIGDLVVTVQHSLSGRTATLFNRVGKNSLTTGKGDSSNLNGNYSFRDGSPSLWSEAANGGDTYDLAVGTYAASGSDEAEVSLNNTFFGFNPTGDWMFTLRDLEGGNIGSIGSTTVNLITAIPEPGAIAGLGLLAMFGGIYLRRRFLGNRKTIAD